MIEIPIAGLRTPLHKDEWKTQRFKYLFKKMNRPISDNDGVVTAFRDGIVTLRSNRREDGFTFADKEIGYQGVEPNDLVIHAMDGFAGAIGVSDSRGKCSPVYSIAVPKNQNIAHSKFWGYYLRNLAISGFIESLAKGIRERSTDFRWKDVSNLLVNFPDYEIQKEIADFLDRETGCIDQLIEKKEKLVNLMKERETNTINEKFSQLKNNGCQIWKLGHVCRVQRGKFTHRPRNAPELYDGDAPFIQTGDVARAEKFITQHKQTLSELGMSVSAKFPANTLLMAIAANVGNVAISTYEVYCPDSVVGFIPSKKINSEYLYYTLRAISDDISSSSTSNAQDNTNVARLGSLKIPLPDITQQQELIQSFKKREDLLFKTTSAVSASIEKLRKFRTSLITEAVTGQLDIKAWQKKGGADKRLDTIEEAMAS